MDKSNFGQIVSFLFGIAKAIYAGVRNSWLGQKFQ